MSKATIKRTKQQTKWNFILKSKFYLTGENKPVKQKKGVLNWLRPAFKS